MGTETTQEKRIRRLEDAFNALKGILEGIKHKLGQVAEDNSRDTKPLNTGGASIRHFFAQADGDISGASDNLLGAGSAKLLQNIGGARYQLDPPSSVDVVNTTTGGIDDLTYLELIFSKGVYSIVVGNCAPATSAAPAPPGA